MSYTSFFWVTPVANEFATYSGGLRNCNPLDWKSTIFFLMSTPRIWIRKILLAIRDCLQQLAWYIAPFACWRRASCVGGMASSDQPFVANNAFWQSLTDSRRLDWSYKRVTYLSIVGNSSFSSWSEGKLEHESLLLHHRSFSRFLMRFSSLFL